MRFGCVQVLLVAVVACCHCAATFNETDLKPESVENDDNLVSMTTSYYNDSLENSTIDYDMDLKNDTESFDTDEDELTTDNGYYSSYDGNAQETSTNEQMVYSENEIIYDRLAFQQYKSETNYVLRNENEKFAQTLASYRFLSVFKGEDLSHTVDETNHDNHVTIHQNPSTTTAESISDKLNNLEENQTSNDEDFSDVLIDTQREELLEFVALDTFRTFKPEQFTTLTLTPVTVKSDDDSFNTISTGSERSMAIELNPALKEKILDSDGLDKMLGAFDKFKIPLEDHKYYKSRFINDSSYFAEHWANITSSANKVVIRPKVNKSAFEQSYMKKLRFVFPYFGHNVTNITISTGGYIMTGMADTTWFADGQGLMPFMTNFDTTSAKDFDLVLNEELDRLTVIWENMPLFGNPYSRFTFSATMYNDGDVTFAYKELPISAKELLDTDNLMEIGLADSYYVNKNADNAWQKISHSYTRLAFEDVGVVSGSVLELHAQPACPQYTSCSSCLAHSLNYSNFECFWCKKLQKCTSGKDYNRPLLSECHFSNSCDETMEPTDASPTVFNFLVKFFFM